jgi:hypothetical protein
MELTAAEGRVLGCLIEKAAIAPDAYPVSLNELRLACNQTSGRDPVLAYDDRTVEDTLLALKSKGLARFVPPGGRERATRYSHRADVRWRLGPADLAVLAVLLLCGPQTLGAVHARATRLYPFDHSGEVEAVLDALAARTPAAFATRLDSPAAGDRVRWAQVLAGPLLFDEQLDGGPRPGGEAGVVGDPFAAAPTYAELSARVFELERRLAAATERPTLTVDDGGHAGEGDAGVRGSRWHEIRAVERDRAALPAGSEPGPDALADRLANIERRLARIEAELGALR